MKLLDSDEEEEDQTAGNSAVTEREAIANELFEGGEDVGEVLGVKRHIDKKNQKSVNTRTNNCGRLLCWKGKPIRCEMNYPCGLIYNSSNMSKSNQSVHALI